MTINRAEGEKSVDKKVLGSEGVEPEDRENVNINRKEARREAQGAQGLSKNCRGTTVYPFVGYDQKISRYVSIIDTPRTNASSIQ